MNESDIVKVGGSAFCKVEVFLQEKTVLCKIMEELKVLQLLVSYYLYIKLKYYLAQMY